MKWNFEDKSLKNGNTTIKEFDSPIHKIVDFDECVVVLLNRDYYKKDNENIFCVNELGALIWQVPKFEYVHETSPFVDVSKDGQNAKLWNWESSWIIIEPSTGDVILTPRESRKGRRPW